MEGRNIPTKLRYLYLYITAFLHVFILAVVWELPQDPSTLLVPTEPLQPRPQTHSANQVPTLCQAVYLVLGPQRQIRNDFPWRRFHLAGEKQRKSDTIQRWGSKCWNRRPWTLSETPVASRVQESLEKVPFEIVCEDERSLSGNGGRGCKGCGRAHWGGVQGVVGQERRGRGGGRRGRRGRLGSSQEGSEVRCWGVFPPWRISPQHHKG